MLSEPKICPECGDPIFQCERCGGSGVQQAGRYWNVDHYEGMPTQPCRSCFGKGNLYHHHEPGFIDPWLAHRKSGCNCQVENAAGYPEIVIYDPNCPVEDHAKQGRFEDQSD